MKTGPDIITLSGDDLSATRISGIKTGIVYLPEGGITLSKGKKIDLTALFETEFVDVREVTVVIKFTGDLFEPGDAWVIDSFGGVKLQGTSAPRKEQRLRITECREMMRFCTGRFKFYIRSDSGTMNISEIKFLLSGVSINT